MKHFKKLLIVMVIILMVGCQANDQENNTATVEEVNQSPDNNVTEVMTTENSKEQEVLLSHLSYEDIDSSRAVNVIAELASEKYEGRQAGVTGMTLAEDYVVELYKEIGLLSPEGIDYRQVYEQKAAYPVKATEVSIIGSDMKLEYQIDFTERFNMGKLYYDAEFESEMVFIRKVSQLKEDIEALDNKVLLMTQTIYYDDNTWDLLDKIMEEGIKLNAIVVSTSASDAGMRVARYVHERPGVEFEEDDPVFISVDLDVFTELMNVSKEGAKLKVSMDYQVEDVQVPNIVGYIPGKNEVGEDETLIIGAHLDHVGNNMNGTYNAGALDNASGISVMLEMARAIKAGEQPEDTIIFVAFNGEEDGLLGSEYFANNPALSYDPKHTQMLNLDMVGSSHKVPLDICAYDSSGKEMQTKLAELAKSFDLYHKKANFGGSDHVNFASLGIPAVMLIHFDDAYYHTYLDTVENAIGEPRLNDVIRLALAFIDQEIYE